MTKNIIICSDGTGNTTVKNRGTNVFKLFEAIKTHRSSIPQLSIYDDGVGSGTSKFSQIIGGAFGYGLSRNIKQLYLSLVRNYQPGDNIYLFGFSRGAFTVRSLAGLISYMGIIDRSHCKTDEELRAYVNHAYREYRRSQRGWLEILFSGLVMVPALQYQKTINNKQHLIPGEEFKEKFSINNDDQNNENKKLIRFIGVWDTVSAVGFPVPWVTRFFNTFIYRFSFTDNYLNNDVAEACQSLSIDDQRKTFHPELWHEKNETDKQRITQVWFSGVHSNVGGGYAKQGMSLVTLNWMMRKASQAGIEFIQHDMDLYCERQNIYDKLYNSRAGLSVYYRFKPRDIFSMCQRFSVEPQLHSSVINRLHQGTEGYAPGNLPKNFTINDSETIPCHWPDASAQMSSALGEDSSLLSRVIPWYLIRKFSHGIFFIATVYLAYDFYQSKPEVISSMDFSAIPLAFLKYHLSLDNGILGISWVVLLLIGFYFLLIYTKEKMHNIYSSFWYRLIQNHKQVVNND